MRAEIIDFILQGNTLLNTHCKAISNGLIHLAFDSCALRLFLLDELCFRILDQQYPLSYDTLMKAFGKDFPITPTEGVRKIRWLLANGILFVDKDHLRHSDLMFPILRTPLRKRFQPTHIYLSIAQDCNLRCDYCSAGYGRFGKKKKYMDCLTAKRSLDVLICNENGVDFRSVSFAGGEPLLNTETLFFSLEYGTQLAKKNNRDIYFSFNTNGTLLTDEIIGKLTKYPVYATFSIDGTKRVHDAHRRYPNGKGSYDLAVKNFHAYCHKMKEIHGHFYPRLQCCLPQGKGLYEAYVNLKQLGASTLVINPAWPSSFLVHDLTIRPSSYQEYLTDYERILKDTLEQIEHTPNDYRCNMATTMESISQLTARRVKPLGCGAANDGFAIGADGNVYPCGLFMENEGYCIGNVWTDISLERIQKVQQRISEFVSKCIDCWARPMCGAACLPMAIAQGDQNDTEPTAYCELFRGYIVRDLLLYADICLRGKTTQLTQASSP